MRRPWLVLLPVVVLVVVGCGGKAAPQPPPPAPAPSSDAVSPSTTCADPAPGPGYKCVQDCGPPVAREGDPPPGWRWLSPEQQKSREQFGCPRCLPAATRIATPDGDRDIAELAIGDPIFTLDDAGHRIAARVLWIGTTRIAGGHQMVRITLADGRVVSGSAPHPDASGRALGDLARGDRLDGSRVVRVEVVPFTGDQTWDVLPSGSSGLYVADGVVLRSTFFVRSR